MRFFYKTAYPLIDCLDGDNMPKEPENKTMEAWIWDAACSIHGAVKLGA